MQILGDYLISIFKNQLYLHKFSWNSVKLWNLSRNKDLIEIPVIKESWLGEIEDSYHHIPFVSVPDSTPYYIHCDDITKFVLKNDKIQEISKKTKLFWYLILIWFKINTL